jgi:cytochrome oxidase Cu insertion factor (SCO1/SenC/PrrC family)
MGDSSKAVLLVLCFLLAGCSGSDDLEILGTEYRDPPDAPGFTLENQFGEEISLSDFDGKVVVVAFIYTSCPDVCLIISSNLDYVNQNLGEHAEMIEFVSITIDPARDTTAHLLEWTSARGYEWDHLTHERGSVIQAVWDDWNVVVDAEHIANSLPPEEAEVRFAVLFPDNSSLTSDNPCQDPFNLTCFEDGGDFASSALIDNSGVHYDMDNGTIGNWTSNDTWEWNLHSWNISNGAWELVEEEMSEIEVGIDTHLAWIASNANISRIPPGVDCNGRGWLMGTGSGSHCMCDEGWERPGDDWLTCVSEGSSSHSSNHIDPHEESLGEYEIGHSTVTFIIDKDQRKRVAYSGIHWDVNDFLQDVKSLADE